MKLQLCSYELAKLAKEKGFDIPTHSYYFEDGEFKEFELSGTNGYYGEEYTIDRDEFYINWNDKFSTAKNGDRCFGCDENPRYLKTFSAPNLNLLSKWFRDIHSINISIGWWNNGMWGYDVGKLNQTKPERAYSQEGFFSTYEEALEQGLFKTFELI
jgi:hypothetical protein